MSDEMFACMVVLFNTACYVGKEETLFSDFGPLILLQNKNGVQVGEQYVSRKACRNFIAAISHR